MQTIRSIWAWTAITVLILIWVPIMGVSVMTDRDPGRYRTGRWFRRLGAAMTRTNPAWRVRITGNLPANPRLPYIVVGNHQSMADIPVISRLPWDMKWVGKAELFRIPVLGWMMRISHDIPVERKNRRSRAEVLIHAKDRLSKHVSVMFFPEGTRSRDGRIGRFTDGPFGFAIRTGTPVLPIAIDGATDALPKNSWRFGPPADIRVHVFDPVPVTESDDAQELRERIRQQIIGHVAAWRGVEPTRVDALA